MGRYCDFKLSEIKERAMEIRKTIATGQDPIEMREQKRKEQKREQERRLTYQCTTPVRWLWIQYPVFGFYSLVCR